MSSERILIHAPFGRDSSLLSQVLLKEHLAVEICPHFEGLCDTVAHGVGALLLGDEVLGPSQVARLGEELRKQPAWSDLSVIVMTSGGRADIASQRRLKLLEQLQGPVTLLERPLRTATLLSTVHSALRSRRRQYQIRDLLLQEQESASALQAANKALEQSNESLAEFAYAAGHDLQEPLRTLTAYTQLLSRRYGDQTASTTAEYLRFIKEGSQRMKTLIDDLLQYARVTHKSSGIQVQSDCNTAVQSAKDNLTASSNEAGATILCDSLPCVAVDLTQLIQLFQNVIGNAIKYRKPEQDPEIKITVERQGEYWQFNVSDNGIGFEQRYAEHVFGVFKRLQQRTSTSGTGIGLALCKRVVEHDGGRIWATSQPGVGSTFSFLLPGLNQTTNLSIKSELAISDSSKERSIEAESSRYSAVLR